MGLYEPQYGIPPPFLLPILPFAYVSAWPRDAATRSVAVINLISAKSENYTRDHTVSVHPGPRLTSPPTECQCYKPIY